MRGLQAAAAAMSRDEFGWWVRCTVAVLLTFALAFAADWLCAHRLTGMCITAGLMAALASCVVIACGICAITERLSR